MNLFACSFGVNVRGDPVSASHCIVNLFVVVVSTQISFGRAAFSCTLLTSVKISGAI